VVAVLAHLDQTRFLAPLHPLAVEKVVILFLLDQMAAQAEAVQKEQMEVLVTPQTLLLLRVIMVETEDLEGILEQVVVGPQMPVLMYQAVTEVLVAMEPFLPYLDHL